MANEKKARNGAKAHIPMSAAKKSAIMATQGKPAYVGINCIGGGNAKARKMQLRSMGQLRLLKHCNNHPNDDQAMLASQGMRGQQTRKKLIRCSHCNTGFHELRQVDQSLEHGRVVVTCHTCRDNPARRRTKRAAAFSGVSLTFPSDFRESLPRRHSEARIRDAQDNYANLAQKRRFRGPQLRTG